jgi:UDP-N-acetylglucosamine:LPS N-acetylglucosamine transferase
MSKQAPRRPRVLAISSGGGHWVQLLRLRPAFEAAEVHFACTDVSVAPQVAPAPLHAYADANQRQPLRILVMLVQIVAIIVRVRPDVIVSTGAAGGSLAISVGRLLGIKGLFVDSIANARRLSLSARIALHFANAVYTQWPGLEGPTRAVYRGSVL